VRKTRMRPPTLGSPLALNISMHDRTSSAALQQRGWGGCASRGGRQGACGQEQSHMEVVALAVCWCSCRASKGTVLSALPRPAPRCRRCRSTHPANHPPTHPPGDASHHGISQEEHEELVIHQPHAVEHPAAGVEGGRG
jgi:hypothetical protein